MTPPRPIPIKDRVSMVFIEYAEIDVIDGAFVAIDKNGIRTHIPVGSIACILLEPGTRLSHRAAALASQVGTLLVWVGEGGVRLYSSGQPGGARSDRLLYQAKLALDEQARLKIVRKMYEIMLGESPPKNRSVEQLRGLEGQYVRQYYKNLAKQYRVPWNGRDYNPAEWDCSDVPNQCLSVATSCLYGVTEAAILAAGYAPAVGFIHTGKALSFVYDISDLVKFGEDSVVRLAFQIASRNPVDPARVVRQACRDLFRRKNLPSKMIPLIEEVLEAGELPLPRAPSDSIGPVISDKEGLGDVGHRR